MQLKKQNKQKISNWIINWFMLTVMLSVLINFFVAGSVFEDIFRERYELYYGGETGSKFFGAVSKFSAVLSALILLIAWLKQRWDKGRTKRKKAWANMKGKGVVKSGGGLHDRNNEVNNKEN